jgi:hypothetical protein
MLDNPLPELHRMAHQLNPTVVSTTLDISLVLEDTTCDNLHFAKIYSMVAPERFIEQNTLKHI